MRLLRRRRLSRKIYRVAIMFGSLAKQLKMQSRNMEKQAERKLQRVREMMRRGHIDVAKEEAAKVLTFRKRALEFDIFAENLKDISTTLIGLAPLDDVAKTLKKGVKIVSKLASQVNMPAVAELFGELGGLMRDLGITMEHIGEPGGVSDVVSEAFSEEEIAGVLKEAVAGIEAEIPVPDIESLEERLKKLKEGGK